MKKFKFLLILITLFFVSMPVVFAEEQEYDFKLNTSYLQMYDYDDLTDLKVAGYNKAITSDEYLDSHNVIENYNEFYLNNGYYIANSEDGKLSIYFDFSGEDYIRSLAIRFDSSNNENFSEFNNRIMIGSYYSVGYSFNNVYEVLKEYTYGFFSWIDPNVNNSDFWHEWTIDDLTDNNDEVIFNYPILSTNRSFKWYSVNDFDKESIRSTLSHLGLSLFITDIHSAYMTSINIESLNSAIGNVFRHPYSAEITDEVDDSKISTVFSINTSYYTSLRIKYHLNTSLKKNWYWWTNPWSYGDDQEKRIADWLKIEVNSTSYISYPRRYTGYKRGSDIEYQKMPNDFNSVLSTNYLANITSLDARNGAVEGYFDFDLRDLPENTIITVHLQYNPEYVEFEPIELPETNFQEYDFTGKYAVGLVPKFYNSVNKFTLMYQGSFISYYSFNNNTFNVYDAEDLLSSNDYSKKILEFSNFLDSSEYEKPVFYLINNYYKVEDKPAKIKYNPDYFDLLVYDTPDSIAHSDYTGYDYSSPNQNFTSTSSGINNNNSSGSSLSLGDVFSNLPSYIAGLGSAFSAIGECITLAFSSMPAIVQAVLMFSLIITILFVAIKLIRG